MLIKKYIKVKKGLSKCVKQIKSDTALLQPRLKIRTWMPWHRPRDTVVPIEELSPEEFIPGDSQPLMAGEASTQDSIVG